MAILYNKLFQTLQARGKNKNYLRKNGISPSILTKINNGSGALDTRTINRLCMLLDCQPSEIMEYRPD